MVKPLEVMRPTQRDILLRVAGPIHGEHTVIAKSRVSRGLLSFTCSCGKSFEVAATEENKTGLRNVVEYGS